MTIWNITFCEALNNEYFEVISRGSAHTAPYTGSWRLTERTLAQSASVTSRSVSLASPCSAMSLHLIPPAPAAPRYHRFARLPHRGSEWFGCKWRTRQCFWL
jgi:hypothetical protein